MSFKGIKKTIVRAPQSFRQKMNMGEITADAVYIDAERRFKELEVETKKLSEESKRYFTAVNGMLNYQIDFSKAIEEIYKPISGRLSDPNSTVQEDNPEGIRAAEQYREVVKELKETLKPDLELIEKRIVQPAQELLKVINNIRKMATKRDHKQVDLDRHKRTHQKYVEKKEKTVKDEEKMYSAEADLLVAQEEYNYYNDMLKQELPILFQMQRDFIKPLFESFYYMQLNIFYTMYFRMEELKIPYFDLNLDIVEAYHAKKGNIEEQTDAVGITHFKVGHAKSKLEMTKRRHQMAAGGSSGTALSASSAAGTLPAYTPGAGQYGQYGQSGNEKLQYMGAAGYQTYPSPGQSPATQQTQPYGQASTQYAQTSPQYGQASPQYGQASPQYGQASPQYGQAFPQHAQTGLPAYNTGQVPGQAPVQAYAPPPPPAAVPVAVPAAETCTALYDYTAQAAGDLTFTAGAVIEIIEKGDANAWWSGRYNGQTGSFPGNYVQLNQK